MLKSNTFEGISLKYEKQREAIREKYIPKKRTLQGDLEKSKKEEKSERRELVKKKVDGVKDRLAKRFTSKGERTFFSKPTAKPPRKVDPKKFITQGLSNEPLVRKGRTGYIKEEMIKETKWLS